MKNVQLICIPYAGGSAMIYNKWKRFLTPNIQLCLVELAGRGMRSNTPFYPTLELAVEDVYASIENIIDGSPYIIFGHSLGSLLAYEVCYKILSRKKAEEYPVATIFSGGSAPQLELYNQLEISNLPKKEFEEKMLELNGTPKEIFEYEELSNIFTPIIRADYNILENYNFVNKQKKLPWDIYVFNGKQDLYTENSLKGWEIYAGKHFTIKDFDGDHFFINQNTKEVVKEIKKIIDDL